MFRIDLNPDLTVRTTKPDRCRSGACLARMLHEQRWRASLIRDADTLAEPFNGQGFHVTFVEVVLVDQFQIRSRCLSLHFLASPRCQLKTLVGWGGGVLCRAWPVVGTGGAVRAWRYIARLRHDHLPYHELLLACRSSSTATEASAAT